MNLVSNIAKKKSSPKGEKFSEYLMAIKSSLEKKYNRFGRSYKGLDCSGKSKVLPPTFEGIRALVNKVGESAAYAAFPNTQEPEKSTIEEDIVLDFVDDLNHASDKVERLTLLEEFSGYLDQVRVSLENPQPEPQPERQPEPEPQEPPQDSQK